MLYNKQDFKKIVMTFKTFKDFLQVYNKFITNLKLLKIVNI
jgi:hypothetical protein